MATDPRVADIVRARKIRLALFLPQYTKDPVTGELRGLGAGFVALEVVRALAACLEIPMQVIEQPTPPKAVECLKTGACDVAFLGIVPSRAAEVDFSPPVFQFDYTCLVPGGSSIRSLADADRPGVRIATVQSHASSLALASIVKRAELVGAERPDAAFDLLRTGKAEIFALPREQLLDYAAKLPGSRVLDQGYGINRVGMAIAKGHPGRLAFVSEFIEAAKASGLVQQALDAGGLLGFQVSPPGSVSSR